MPSTSRSVPLARVIAVTAIVLAQGCTCAAPAKERGSSSVLETSSTAVAEPPPAVARGMWVWRTAARLGEPGFGAELLDVSRRARLNEMYLSVGSGALDDARLPSVVAALRGAGVRVEALLGDALWVQPGKRGAMLAAISAVAAFNDRHPGSRFAGIHLDIEPHQLAENRGSHAFLPALAEALTEASALGIRKSLSTSADLPRFALEEQGPAFARAVGRPFVMLYELRDKSAERLTAATHTVLDKTFAGARPDLGGRLVVGLSVSDYPTDLESRLEALGPAHRASARYGGWAIHDEQKYESRTTP